MTKIRLSVVVVLAAATLALAQQGTVRIHTHALPPTLDTLDRLNLKLAWRTKVPIDGARDGFYSVQLFPGKDFPLMIAQTYRGSVIAINAETGDMLWRTTVGLPYKSILPVGVNEQAVFVCRHETLFALDRDEGRQLLYTVEPDTNLRDYGYRLETAPTAGLAADAFSLYVCFGDRLVRYAVPNFRVPAKTLPIEPPPTKLLGSPQPIRLLEYTTSGHLSEAPVISQQMLAIGTDSGEVTILKKSSLLEDRLEIRQQFTTGGPVVAPLAHVKSLVMVGCQDYFLYAFDGIVGRLAWRFDGQAAIQDAPHATDADVFVTVSNAGLHRLDIANGRVKWAGRDAVKFLATNQRFVYALDRQGKMLVLDYERGKTLAAWDARDWRVPVPNDRTDRIYLANNDGQIMCLHHRDTVKPLEVRIRNVAPAKGKEVEKKDADKAPKVDDKMPPDKEQGQVKNQTANNPVLIRREL